MWNAGFLVEKSADMVYNKLLGFAGAMGDYGESSLGRDEYEKWKKS